MGGDGGWCAWDQNNPNIFYGEYVFLSIHRNTDGGTTPDIYGNRYISGLFYNSPLGDWDWKPFPYSIPDAENQNALFIAPFILDPNNSNKILAGGESLWRTSDARPQYIQLRSGVPALRPEMDVYKGPDEHVCEDGHRYG